MGLQRHLETPLIPPCNTILFSRHAERLKGMLDSTSGNIVIGGTFDLDNKFMEPTIVTGVDIKDSTMKVAILRKDSLAGEDDNI